MPTARPAGREIAPARCASPPNVVASAARGVNAAGLVIGDVTDSAGRRRAAVWRLGPPDTLEVLPTPVGYADAWAEAVNAAGVIVGTAVAGAGGRDGPARAVRWAGGTARVLALPPGYASATGLAVNAQGDVAGGVVDARGSGDAALWRGASVAVLDAGEPGDAEASALSDAGVAAGTLFPTAHPDGNAPQAVVWRGASATLLFARAEGSRSLVTRGTPGGLVVGEVGTATRTEGTLAFAYTPAPGGGAVDTTLRPHGAGRVRYTGANDRGVLVGVDDATGSFVRIAGRLRALPRPPGWLQAEPATANDVGVIAGTASSPEPDPKVRGHDGTAARTPPTRAVVWDSGGRVRLLPLTAAGCATWAGGATSR